MRARVFVEPQEGATYDELLAAALTAERCGFDAFFRSDHLLHIGPEGGRGPTEAWATLAGLARETSRIRLGTLVSSATFRLPGVLAVTATQVDAMSDGRLELGIGTGWFEREHLAFGIEFPPIAERFARLEEQLAIITGLWSTPVGSSFNFVGRHYRLEDCPVLAKPVQQPAPPIIIGGWGTRRTPEIAARYASEFNLAFGSLSSFTEHVGYLHAACRRLGRDPADLRLSAALTVCCGRDGAEVAARKARIGPAFDQMPNAMIGTPTELLDRLAAFGAAGADTIYLQTLDVTDLEHIELLGETLAALS